MDFFSKYDDQREEFIFSHLGDEYRVWVGINDIDNQRFWEKVGERAAQVVNGYYDLMLSCKIKNREEFLPRPVDWLYQSNTPFEQLAQRAKEFKNELEEDGYKVIHAECTNPFTGKPCSPVIAGIRAFKAMIDQNAHNDRWYTEPVPEKENF